MDRIRKILEEKNIGVIAIYCHGSYVYGCWENGDYDFIVVTDKYYGTNRITDGNYDFSLFTEEEWRKEAEDNSVDFMECAFLPNNMKYEKYSFDYTIIRDKIRSSFSSKASNSFVKCKKKLTVEKDYNPYIAKKSLFHSFRILVFGIQILEFGKIIDYSAANQYYCIVEDQCNDWDYFKEKYQKEYNSLKHKFRMIGLGD